MFDKKLDYLFGKKPIKTIELVTSGNGSTKLSSSGNPFVDQFAYITNYRKPRPFSDIAKDMETLWKSNPLNAMKLIFYIRMITRKVELCTGYITKETQRGQGLRYESIMRMIYVALNYPEVFYNNLPLFIAAGSWKDIIQMMSYDLQFNGWKHKVLDWKKLGDFILAGLENPKTSELIKKYLPTIKAVSKCNTLESQADTIIGKYLAHRIFKGEKGFNPFAYDAQLFKDYRLLKSSGTAHQWQQQISKGNFNINFNSVHGRALALLVSGNYLKNHNLEETYEKWILSQPVAKFTGYVYELFKNLSKESKNYQKVTIDKQFENLIQTAKVEAKSSFLSVLDISGSMGGKVPGINVSSGDIAKAMGIYFSCLLQGPFANSYIEFNRKPVMKYWVGDTPSAKYLNGTDDYYGDTNFLGVADLLIKIFKDGVPISQFPEGILCLSDGEFNPNNEYYYYGRYSNKGKDSKTIFVEFKDKLLEAGFPEEYVKNFKIVLWDIPNGYYAGEIRPKFESDANYPNFFYMSGLDPAGIAFLLGEKDKPAPKTPKELFEAAMDQELLNLIVI